MIGLYRSTHGKEKEIKRPRFAVMNHFEDIILNKKSKSFGQSKITHILCFHLFDCAPRCFCLLLNSAALGFLYEPEGFGTLCNDTWKCSRLKSLKKY